MKHLDLFAGIGGFSLAAHWAGWETVAWCEIDKFCQKILTKRFPNAAAHGDIKNLNGYEYRGTVDIISGGFPCQPYSVAGQRRGNTDDRVLWPEMLRVIREVQPSWIVGENVAGIISMDFEQVCTDLEGEGYKVQAFIIPACAVGAIHRRDRIWIIAQNSDSVRRNESIGKKESNTAGFRESCAGNEQRIYNETDVANSDRLREPQQEGGVKNVAGRVGDSCFKACRVDSNSVRIGRENGRYGADEVNADQEREKEDNEFRDLDWGCCKQGVEIWQPNDSSDILRAAYGVPGRVDGRGNRIKGIGNAIVPQVAYQIFKAIKDFENSV